MIPLAIYASLASLVAVVAVVAWRRAKVEGLRQFEAFVREVLAHERTREALDDVRWKGLKDASRVKILRERTEWAESQMLPNYAPVTDVHAPSFASPLSAPSDWSGHV